MKKLSSLLLLFVMISTVCFSQQKAVASFKSETNSTTIDTVTNATVKNQSLKIANSATVLSIQVTATKIAGSPTGIVRLYGSNDQVAWTRIIATSSLSAADSLNIANTAGPQTKVFFDLPSRYLWYRAGVTGVGTGTTQIKTIAVAGR